jgi:hypothetical protein
VIFLGEAVCTNIPQLSRSTLPYIYREGAPVLTLPPLVISKFKPIYKQQLTAPTRFEPEYRVSMYLRNVLETANIQTVLTAKCWIDIEKNVLMRFQDYL